jgi:hypothetical protein
MNIGGYCPGCGGGDGHQPCAVVRCAIAHESPEYCYLCGEYPCEKYTDAVTFDSFVTHKNMLADSEKVKLVGIEAYNAEQREKIAILRKLLDNYNDGRRKTLYCTAVNLLDLEKVRAVMTELEASELPETSMKEKAALAVKLFQVQADRNGISLKLRKKK